MAEGSATWNDSQADGDWENDLNWTPNQHPADGHTATFDNEALNPPDTNLPSSGTIGFTYSAGFDTSGDEQDFHWSYLVDGASVGVVTCGHADAIMEMDFGDQPASFVCTAGELMQGNGDEITSDIELDGAGASLVLAVPCTVSGAITDGGSGGEVYCTGGSYTLSDITQGTIVMNIDGGATVVGNLDGDVTCYADSSGARQITGNLTFEAGSTWDLSVDNETFTVDGDWAGTNMTFTHTTAGTIICTGDWSRTAPLTPTNPGTLRLTGSGKTFNWTGGVSFILEFAGNTTLGSGTHQTRGFTIEATATVTIGTSWLRAYVAANDRINIVSGATVSISTGGIIIRPSANWSTTGRVACDRIRFESTDDQFTISGEYDCPDTTIRGESDNKYTKLVLTGSVIDAGDVTLGNSAGTNRIGKLDVSGASDDTIEIGSLAGAGAGTSEFAMGAKKFTTDGNWDGSLINSIASGGNVIVGSGNPTIDNMDDPGNVVTVKKATDGGSNHANWQFKYGTPGSLALLGVGT